MSCGILSRVLWQIRKFYPPLRDATIRTAESIQFIESNNENFLAYIIPNNGLQ